MRPRPDTADTPDTAVTPALHAATSRPGAPRHNRADRNSPLRFYLSVAAYCFSVGMGVAGTPALAQQTSQGALPTRALPADQRLAHAPTPLPEGVKQAGPPVHGITEYRLDNGLKILLSPDLAKSTLTVNLVYRVGARHEAPGEAGMAHLLGRLVFNGPDAHPFPGREMHRRGITVNAATSHDSTHYYGTFPASDTSRDRMLDWLAGTMQNLRIAEAPLDRERRIMLNGMAALDDSPRALLRQQLKATAYQVHPYGRPVTGTMSDVDAITPGRLQRFYRTYYRPDNAVLVISGPFDVAETLASIRQRFGPIRPPATPIPQPYLLEPVQPGEREVIIRRQGGTPMVEIGYHIPSAAGPDLAALSVLGMMLAASPDGPLYQKLVKPGHATEVQVHAGSEADPGMLIFSVSFTDESRRSLIRRTMEEVIEDTLPIDQTLLTTVQQFLKQSHDGSPAAPDTDALSLTGPIGWGDWRLRFAQLQMASALTLSDLRHAAAHWLVRDNRTTAWYLPTPYPRRAPLATRSDIDVLLARQSFPPGRAFTPEAPLTAETIHANTQTGQLPGGLRYALLPRRTTGEKVSISLDLHWGSLRSLSGRWREADMLGILIGVETKTLSHRQLQERLSSLDASLTVTASSTGARAHLETPRQHLEIAMTLMASVLREPVFRAEQIEEARQTGLEQLRAIRREPATLVAEAFNQRARHYPPHDPRHNRSDKVYVQDLKAQTAPRLTRFWQDFAGASRGELAAIGDFDPEILKQLTDKLFGDWQTPHPYTPFERDFHDYGTGTIHRHSPDQTHAVFTQMRKIRMSRQHPDHLALEMAVRMLGGGTENRLWSGIQEKLDLSTSISAELHVPHSQEDATLLIDATFAPKNLKRLEQALQKEISLALAKGFTQPELDAARQALQEEREAHLRDESGVLALLRTNLYRGTDMKAWMDTDEKLARLTLNEVNAAFRRWFLADRALTVVAGSFDESEP